MPPGQGYSGEQLNYLLTQGITNVNDPRAQQALSGFNPTRPGGTQRTQPPSGNRPYDFGPTAGPGIGRGSSAQPGTYDQLLGAQANNGFSQALTGDQLNYLLSQGITNVNDPRAAGALFGRPGGPNAGAPAPAAPDFETMFADLFADYFGGVGPGEQYQVPGTNIGRGYQPETFGILNPSEFGFGFGQGVPGGDAVRFLEEAGFPDVNLLQSLQQGQALGRTDTGSAADQLGGLPLFSPQSLANLGPSGVQFLMGLYSTMLGIPEEDLINAAFAPFRGLGSAAPARQSSGFIR